ncbi:glycosyltransferase [Phormidesmis priestleyi ULC007]|uniref:Glycosyltransferase n=1 Tax=Phormidesmis priestleyi ULC007 TaxID=1920490 RepID=A0A2T1DFU1_9CYAN|nr:WecB/TagA/CpsF family glycosyltransferase [Phormidesmis priestleyi]PSB19362.1 glycosyltransferase [Phormidesmis priestleyi ULC007]PZO52277.1 MAG: glycosyltransferase [Phormidesmis priestleyi]
MGQVKLLNIGLHNITMLELLDKLRFGGVVFTTNVDHLIKLQKDKDFYLAYQGSDYRVCDSQVLLYASNFLGTPLPEKLSGSDLFPAFYTYYKHDKNVKVFLLGAAPGVAKQAQKKINLKVGRDIVIASYSPTFGFEKDEEECQKIIDLIDQSGATVLAIGVGAPKQELWLTRYKDQLKNVKLFLAIGATIDFEAGNIQRSPKWMSQVGLEWLHRTLCEPKRLWKRYIVDDLPFFWLIIKQRFKLYQNPWSYEKQSLLDQPQSTEGAICDHKLKGL